MEEIEKSDLLIFASNSTKSNKYQFNRVVSETFLPPLSSSIAVKAATEYLLQSHFLQKTAEMVVNEQIS